MRIFLIKPPTGYSEAHYWLEPLGLAYIAAVCRDAGHEVEIFDLGARYPEEVHELFHRLDKFRPDVIGISAMTEEFKSGLEIARAAKIRYDCPIIFGGWHVSGDPSAVMHPAIDYVVKGEGEDTILELLEHIETGNPPLPTIDGIAFKTGDSFQLNPPRTRIKKINRIPTPMREGLPITRYNFPGMWAHPLSKTKSLSVQASRGCPYKCTFCQTPAVWSNIWTLRTPALVVDEIEELVDRYDINTLFFRDEEFTLRPSQVMELCEEMIRRGLPKKVLWGAFGRVDDMSPELARTMRDAGCVWMLMGLEASSPQQSERLQKYYRREEVRRALEICRSTDILVQGSWIIGFPWDTLEELDSAFEWLSSLPLDFLSAFYATPFAGTPLREYVDQNGLLLTDDTNFFNIREPVIRTPHIPYETLCDLKVRYSKRFYLHPKRMANAARLIARRPARARILAELLSHFVRERIPALRKPREVRRPGLLVPQEYFVASGETSPASERRAVSQEMPHLAAI